MNFKNIIGLILIPMAVFADNSKELISAYFPESVVNESLPLANVPRDQWVIINQELCAKSGEMIRMVEEKASKMEPNPLLDSSQIQVAAKLFREALFQVFSDVMRDHGVTDEDKIKEMLGHIQQLKAERYAQGK